MARTFATAGSCIGTVATSWVEYLRPSTFKEQTTSQAGMSAYMKLETIEDMFGEFGESGESDGMLFQKPCILKAFQLYATNRRGGCEGSVRSKDLLPSKEREHKTDRESRRGQTKPVRDQA